MQKVNFVTIRGTKEGLILILDDQCSFSELVTELKEKLSSKYPHISESPAVQVKITVGNRFLTEEQEELLKKLVCEEQKLIVTQIESNVITKEEADVLKKEGQTATVVKIVRSGQVLKVSGDLLLLGDVNPGARVVASGNIYILGVLRGIAHAGSEGNKEAVIAAARMEPSQLRIAEVVSRSPDKKESTGTEIECAYIGADNKIVIERIQHLGQLRPGITNITM